MSSLLMNWMWHEKGRGGQRQLQDLGAEQLENIELTFTKTWMTGTVLGERSETQSWRS